MLRRWDDAVSPDLHQFFGIDTETEEFGARPWWWARARILALLDIKTSRFLRHFDAAATT